MTAALSANLEVNRSPHVVREGIDDHLAQHAVAVAFQEGSGYLGIIRDLAGEHGYRPPIVAGKGTGRGMDSSSLLIRSDIRLIAAGAALVMAAWIGPRLRIKWPGRGIPWAVIDLPIGTRIERTLVASIHAPTGRLRDNKRAWRRYLRRLRRLYRRTQLRYGVTAVLYLGDWNCPQGDTDPTSVRRLLAERIDARIVTTGTPIDYAVTDLPLTGTTGPSHGSDHRSVRFTWKAV